MRYALVLTAAALFAPATLRAADPPITFQTHPIDKVLGDLRSAADLIGGEKAVKAVNGAIKEKLGEKGFEGLDLTKPVVGYITLAPKLEESVVVLALPATGEKEFLNFCERWNDGNKPKDLGKGIYEVPPLFPEWKARMKFADGYAYIAAGKEPEGALDEKALVAPGKLFDPAEKALFAGKLHFDRLTPEVKKGIATQIAELKKKLEEFVKGPAGAPEKIILAGLPEIEKMLGRYLLLLGGADTLTLRLGIDVQTSDVFAEATLKPKADSALAKLIAERKPTTNKFAGLLTTDTAVGFKARLPFFNDELKAAGTKALEEGQKMALENAPEVGKAATEELFKGLIRTVKTGEFDIAASMRGPDKDGEFTLVGAVAFEDPSALEKEFKKFFENDAPKDEQDRMKWNAAKAGNVNIHTYQMKSGGFIDLSLPFGGDKAVIAFAFAPKGVFAAVGPDPIPVLKDALALKPVESPVLDVVVNPSRLVKLADKINEGSGLEVEKRLGKEDKLLSAASLRVTSGKELSVKFAMNLRLIPRALAAEEFDAEKSEKKDPDKPEKK